MGEHLASGGHDGGAGVLFNEVGGSGCMALNTCRGGVGGAAGVESACLWECVCVWGGVGGGGDSRLRCMFHRVRGGGAEVGGAASLGGLIRSLFIGPQPQRSVCLSACMMEGIKS